MESIIRRASPRLPGPSPRAPVRQQDPTSAHYYPWQTRSGLPGTDTGCRSPQRAHTVSPGWLVIWGTQATHKAKQNTANGVGRQKASSTRAVKGKQAPPARGGSDETAKIVNRGDCTARYEPGSCEDGGFRLLPVTHQDTAKGTHHTHTHETKESSSRGRPTTEGKPKQSVENVATTN